MRINSPTLFWLILACTVTSAVVFIPGSNPSASTNTTAVENLQRQKMAVFDASRQANSPAIKPLLQKALDDNILSASEYYGELGHMLSVAVDGPSEILREILESKDQHGFEVALGAMAAEPVWMKTASPQELHTMAEMLQRRKSELEAHVSGLDIFHAFTFQNWLRSMMNLQPSQEAQLELVSQLIDQESANPRQAIAIEYAIGNSELLDLLKPSVREKLKQDLAHYLASNPDDHMARYIVIKRNEN